MQAHIHQGSMEVVREMLVWLLSCSVPTAYSVACTMTFDLHRDAIRKEFLLIAQRSKPGYSPGQTESLAGSGGI